MSANKKKKPRVVETWITIAVFCLLFVGMMVYFCLFVKNNEQELISNSYNSRQQLLAKENIRGNIYDTDGNVLAQTLNDSNGKEYRNYPYGNLFSHSVGFINKGKMGIEQKANYYLINTNIPLNEKVENDMAGIKNPGNDVYISLDYDLQKIASDSLGVYKGAVIVSNVKTGEILAMVSKPDFDPNTIVQDWDGYLNSSNSVLVNRVTQGIYPPGSTFKIVTALEYIKENPDTYNDYSYTCKGRYVNGDISISCFHGSVHDNVNFRKSFAKSCNSSFANIGMSLDRNKFGNTLTELLFNSDIPYDFNYNKSTLLVDSTVADDDMAQISIGQGIVGITPLQLNLITNAIANDGILMKPYMIEKIVDSKGNILKEYNPDEYGRLISEFESEALTELMVAVVNEGTGTKLKSDYYQAAGKTGSAEFNGDAADSHAWFTGFAPAEDPEVSVTIIVEGVGTGGEYAVPIAKRLIDAYFGVY